MNNLSNTYYTTLSNLLSYNYQSNVKPDREKLAFVASRLLHLFIKENQDVDRLNLTIDDETLVILFRKYRDYPYLLDRVKGIEINQFHLALIDIAHKDYNGNDHENHLSESEVLYLVSRF